MVISVIAHIGLCWMLSRLNSARVWLAVTQLATRRYRRRTRVSDQLRARTATPPASVRRPHRRLRPQHRADKERGALLGWQFGRHGRTHDHGAIGELRRHTERRLGIAEQESAPTAADACDSLRRQGDRSDSRASTRRGVWRRRSAKCSTIWVYSVVPSVGWRVSGGGVISCVERYLRPWPGGVRVRWSGSSPA